jgi:hypothetical protein
MQHVQLHVTFFSCIRQVAKDKISSSAYNNFKVIATCNYNVTLEKVKHG